MTHQFMYPKVTPVKSVSTVRQPAPQGTAQPPGRR
jgi:hypothetical protein